MGTGMILQVGNPKKPNREGIWPLSPKNPYNRQAGHLRGVYDGLMPTECSMNFQPNHFFHLTSFGVICHLTSLGVICFWSKKLKKKKTSQMLRGGSRLIVGKKRLGEVANLLRRKHMHTTGPAEKNTSWMVKAGGVVRKMGPNQASKGQLGPLPVKPQGWPNTRSTSCCTPWRTPWQTQKKGV